MSILDALIGIVAPHNCLGCDAEGKVLCANCSHALVALPERCFRCHKLMIRSLTCTDCQKFSQLAGVRVAAVYEAVAKSLIWKLKLAGVQSAATIMARQMAALISGPTTNVILVPVPTATSRVRQRGYDQAGLLARALSRQTRLPYNDCLTRLGQTHQHGLSRQQRLTQLATAFRVTKGRALQQARIILVDDVTTTGATLEAAANTLRAAGAAHVEAVVFAQPLKN
jgi:ComF family protein